MLDVYDAVASEPLFALHHTEPNLECPVGRGIQPALNGNDLEWLIGQPGTRIPVNPELRFP